MSNTFAIIKEGTVANVVVLASVEDWHSDGLLIRINGPVGSRHVEVGWAYVNGEFIAPTLPELSVSQDLPVQAAAFNANLEQEQAIAAYLVKIGVLKENPFTVGVTTL